MWLLSFKCTIFIKERNNAQLHRPTENFASYQRGVHYASTKIFNKLPASTAELVKKKNHFILALKRCLIVQSFYSIHEYLNKQH